MITINLNGRPLTVGVGCRVDFLVSTLTDTPRGFAVALNGVVLPKGQWSTTTVSNGDRVEVLTAAPGG